MNKIILILTLLIIQIHAEYTINQFNELCSTKHPDQFAEKLNQFKNEYKKSFPTNYYFESNEQDLASKLNPFDYGYSAININKPGFLEPSYCSLIGGSASCERDFLLWQL